MSFCSQGKLRSSRGKQVEFADLAISLTQQVDNDDDDDVDGGGGDDYDDKINDDDDANF